MSALVAALYENHTAAERVRTALVREGFPTDRVELTSEQEPGQAALSPADSAKDQLRDYFVQFFDRDDEQEYVRTFVEGVRHGHASVVVHPRGDIETNTALSILRSSQPLELHEHDLANQAMERAASPVDEAVVEKLTPGKRDTPGKRKR